MLRLLLTFLDVYQQGIEVNHQGEHFHHHRIDAKLRKKGDFWKKRGDIAVFL